MYTCTFVHLYASVIPVHQERYTCITSVMYMYHNNMDMIMSSNIFMHNTLHFYISLFPSSEEFSLLNAAFQIIRGGVIPLDIATVQTGDGGKCYMSLLANWGLVADVDIESEKFRKIGETRFILGMKP